ncbi:hypothetical protein EDB82DRAFT_11607 [Fusarium venenatum]|uniref:uncharacterized protein n=1 Tax=Fusarium venenatum TaxID=56646 RepID=UPI001D48A650|nr:hypothetical protein EDB82DRAFT_11607 [Fusarium venenatum]
MAVPEYRDEVLIILSSVNPPPNFAFKKRHIFLSKKSPTIQIGRTSKRKTSLEAGKSNAWFDSAVMSRKHALLTFDPETQKVYIKDTDSLHGTYKNDVRLNINEDTEISTGDKIMLGTSIDRGMEKYPPTTIEATLRFGPLSPETRGNSFRVPDDTDCEDISSDEDQVQNSCEMLYARQFRPAHRTSALNNAPIDLTGDEDRSLPSNLCVDAPRLQPVLTLPRLEKHLSQPEHLSQPVSDDDGIILYDYSEDEDEEMGEDPQVDQSAFKETDNVFSVPHSDSSSVSDVEDNRDSASVDDGFDEHDEFEEEDLADFTPSVNNDEKVTGDNPAQASSANNDTPKQQKINVIEDQTTNVFSPPDFSHRAAPGKASFNRMDELYPLSPMPNTAPASSQMLPPISDWANKSFTFESYPPKVAVEAMARKTGKPEFFEAREINKANVGINYGPWSPPLDHFPTAAPCHMQSLKATDRLTQIPQIPQIDRVDQLSLSDLTASGARFINSPEGPFHQVKPEITTQEPVLDETSAFSFEQSKKPCDVDGPIADALAEALAPQKKHQEDVTLEGEAQILTAAENKDEAAKETKELSETPNSSKRNAEEISELTAEEEIIESDEPLIPQQATCRPSKRTAGSIRREEHAAVAPPPPKRLRRMAEVVGYATLGGFAVMSALIATAPAL